MIISLGLNAVFATLLLALWLRSAPTAGEALAARPPPSAPPAVEATARAAHDTGNPARRFAFTWAQIESDDYRQYIANLRAVGCPERLIRDLIVRDVGELYERREAALPPTDLPPWAGRDRQIQANRQRELQRTSLEEEKRAVLQELLGFAWDDEAIRLVQNEEFAWVLLGFLPDDLAVQAMSLPKRYEQAAERIRDQADNILLPADRAALNALADQFEAGLASLLAPQQLEELKLRIQAISALGNEIQLEGADLTAQQAREIARLSGLLKDPIREDLIRAADVSSDEEAQRKLAFNREVAQVLGPEQFAEFERVQDGRYREALSFSQERNLPRQTALKAFEIRQTAEDEARRLRAAKDVEPPARQAQLEQLQQSAAAALTTLLGPQNMTDYLKQPGAWLNELGHQPGQSQP